MKLKNKLLFGFFALFSISQIAFADIDSKSSSKTRKPIYREITPNAGPRVMYGCDIILTADLIWWKTKQSGLVYGATGFLNSPKTAADAFEPIPKGRTAQVEYEWDPGFKVGTGLNFWHDGWDVCIEYTRLLTKGSHAIKQDNDIIPSFIFPNDTLGTAKIFTANRADSRSYLHFNVADLELGRNFYISQFLMLRPHLGLKGSWQSQDWRTRYQSNDLSIQLKEGGTLHLSGPYRMHHHSNYYGVGLRTGLDTAWHFNTNWSLFGDTAWTAMWSRYRLIRRDTIDDTTTGKKQRTHNLSSNFSDIKLVGEFQIGLRYEIWFFDDRYHLQIQVGWEEQLWINHMKFIKALTAAAYYDMTTQGLNAMIRFDF